MPQIDWKLVGTIAGPVIALGALVVGILKWRWERRPDVVTWEIDEHYKIDLDRDRVRFPALFAQENPVRGDTGILLRVRFHGRHALKVIGLTFEWNFSPAGRVPIVPCTLQDGQSWEQLLFTRMLSLDQITAVVIEAEGGRRFKQDINLGYHRAFNAHVGTEKP